MLPTYLLVETIFAPQMIQWMSTSDLLSLAVLRHLTIALGALRL